MDNQNIERWRARLTASEVAILPPALQLGSRFLIRARDPDGAWGSYPGMVLDLSSSAAALQALEACAQKEFETIVQDARSWLSEHIRDRVGTFNLAELVASLRILTRSGRADDPWGIADSIIVRIGNLRNGSGWGSPAPSIPATADVLSALTPHRGIAPSLIESTARFLLSEQRRDGGWAVAIGGSQSLLLPSALSVIALVLAQPRQESPNFESAAQYLSGALEERWQFLISDGGVELTAQALRSAATLKSFPFEIVAQGIEAVLDQSNADGAWGEKKGGNSSVEATSSCVLALCASGANRLVSSRLALSAIDDTDKALRTAHSELELARGDTRSQVVRETGSILKENRRLKARVNELEERVKEKLPGIEDEVFALRQDFESRRSTTRVRRLLELVTIVGLTGTVLAINFIIGDRIQTPLNARILGYAVSAVCAILAVVRAWELVFKPSSTISQTDVSLVRRHLSNLIREWGAGKREEFLHKLSRIPDSSPDERELTARSIARQFSDNPQQTEELRDVLTLFVNLTEPERTQLLYSLREVRGKVAS